MEITELMIGDYVKIKDLKDPVKWIFGIDGFLNKVYYLDGEDLLFTSVDNVLPIPLTVEILLKNNFEKHFDDDIVLYTHPQGIIIEMGINYKLFDDGHFFVRGVQQHLYYVHELQHALRLCGVDVDFIL